MIDVQGNGLFTIWGVAVFHLQSCLSRVMLRETEGGEERERERERESQILPQYDNMPSNK